MKLDDYISALNQDSEYVSAIEKLTTNFALSDAILAYKQEHHLTLVEVARRSGVSTRTMNRIVYCYANPRLSTLDAICAAINVKIIFERIEHRGD